ncbi:MAG: radical SAM family heme chaperone HemW [Cryomorphaceae bacterium]|nr:MAG: radical SAM family heme chaperone HemW [Cryomorphaceae bacterium]
MAGVYFHIPYCKKACHYCDFHFSTNTRTRSAMVDAMVRELQLRHHSLKERSIETIYFGGGTPSLLSQAEIQNLIQAVAQHFVISDDAEITLEANPDDLQPETLSALRSAGINRLSIGIQSFFNEHLRWMNRAHSAEQAKRCIPLAHEAGFQNITADLIYGFPGLSDEQWDENISTLIALGAPHISCYSLTVEPGTALHHFVESGKQPAPDDDAQVRHFLHLVQRLTGAGYEHYEVSNFAIPGYRSRHNSAYWSAAPFLGIGPSAHSFTGTERCWNIANNHQYLKSIEQGQLPLTCEPVTQQTACNEYLLTGLRTAAGIDLNHVKTHWSYPVEERFASYIQGLVNNGRATCSQGKLKLTTEGMLWADAIAAEFFQND